MNRTGTHTTAPARTRKWYHNRSVKFAGIFIALLFIVSRLAPYIATDKPWYINYEGNKLFPAFTLKTQYKLLTEDGTEIILPVQHTDWKQLKAQKVVWAPVPYSPGKTDILNYGFRGPADTQWYREDGIKKELPARYRHWLGTGAKGEDLLSGLLHGTRVSLLIGVLSMLIASVTGITLGLLAGYFSNDGLKIPRYAAWALFPGIFLGWFYGFTIRQSILGDALAASTFLFLVQLLFSMLIMATITGITILLFRLLKPISFFAVPVALPVDWSVSRSVEVMMSLPKILLIITIAAVARRSMLNIILIIGFTSWTGIARLVRAEMLRVKKTDYIAAARASGLNNLRIILRHALPNAIAPALVSIAFGVAAAILAESGLSFLNIGVPENTVTWGALLSEGRTNFKAWWMILFPGLAIFSTVTIYNLLGEGLREALDPSMKE